MKKKKLERFSSIAVDCKVYKGTDLFCDDKKPAAH